MKRIILVILSIISLAFTVRNYTLVLDERLLKGSSTSTTFDVNSTEANIKIELLNEWEYVDRIDTCDCGGYSIPGTSEIRVVITDGSYTLLDNTYTIASQTNWETNYDVISVAQGPQMTLTVYNTNNSTSPAAYVKVSKEDW